jgi:hypothetical protein
VHVCIARFAFKFILLKADLISILTIRFLLRATMMLISLQTQLPKDSAVDRGTGSFPKAEALIMGESVFWDDSACFIDGVLWRDVHWCHDDSWDPGDLLEREDNSIAVSDVFLD